MAALEFVGTTGISAASLLPVDPALGVWALIGMLLAGAVGVSLATVPPSTLVRMAMHRA